MDALITREQALAALRILLAVAGRDTGQSRRVAGYLLSLWDGETYRCDLAAQLYIDAELFTAEVALLLWLRANHAQLDALASNADIAAIIAGWGDTWRR